MALIGRSVTGAVELALFQQLQVSTGALALIQKLLVSTGAVESALIQELLVSTGAVESALIQNLFAVYASVAENLQARADILLKPSREQQYKLW